MRFLVVDDSSVDRHLLTSLLKQLGFETESYENTQGLLDKLAAQNFTAVFLDIVMPEQDGYKFLRELRTRPEISEQHVILYSHKKRPLEISYGLQQAGANDYLPKPVTADSIVKVLEKIQGIGKISISKLAETPADDALNQTMSSEEISQVNDELELVEISEEEEETSKSFKVKKYRGIDYVVETDSSLAEILEKSAPPKRRYRGIEY